MGKASRDKGTRGQREARNLLRACGWEAAEPERGLQRQLGGARVADVDAPGLPVRLEVRVSGKPDALKAFRDAHRDAQAEGKGREPCALLRLVSARGPRDDPCKGWLAVVDAEWLLLMLARLYREV